MTALHPGEEAGSVQIEGHNVMDILLDTGCS